MAELVFNYSVMGGGKTTALILDEFNAAERGEKTLIIKPAVDTRHGKVKGWGTIKSRAIVGQHKAWYVENILHEDFKFFNSIYVDEVQFFKPEDIYELSQIVDKEGINVYCYGLKTDSAGELFKASAKLLAIADRCVEIPCKCKCGRLATHHIRYINGEIAKNQSGIMVEKGKVTYSSLCRHCWKEMLSK